MKINVPIYDNVIISPRGKVTFSRSDNEDGFVAKVENFSDDERHLNEYSVIGDLFTGHDFLSSVSCGSIMDYDGIIGEVYLNGYKTNLGLDCYGLHQGGFKVGEDTWERICERYEVVVEWCNK